MSDIDQLKIQLEIALEALRFYANPENYGQGESFAELSRISDKDLEYVAAHRGFDMVGGKLARRTLAEINNPRILKIKKSHK